MTISIDCDADNFLLTFPYNLSDLATVRSLPVREWNKARKMWLVPLSAYRTLDSVKGIWTDKAIDIRQQIDSTIMKLVDYKFQEVVNTNGSKLYPYQLIGVHYLSAAKTALLADDMGLGKTIQSIQAVLMLGCKKVLILCPATLKGNWQRQLKEHFDIVGTIITGNITERKKQWLDSGQFVIVNYELLQRDWNIIPKTWDAILADEAVYLKNHFSNRTKLTKKLRAAYKFALSGIPIETSLLDFHSIMEWVNPKLLPSLFRFKERYCIKDWAGKVIGYKKVDEIHLLTSPFVLRRKKEEVLKELPPKIYSDFPLQLDEEGLAAYNELADDFIKWLKKEKKQKKSPFLLEAEKLIRLRQFVEFPLTVGFSDIKNVKLEWLDDIYLQTNKLIIFSYFVSSVQLLAERYKTPYVLMGSVPMDQRLPMLDHFNKNTAKSMLVCTDAGRFGLDMIGADTIVHFGYWYNPATILQREDRLHRIGQKNTVHVLRPCIDKTIDQGLINIYLGRASEALGFMDSNEKMSLAKLSIEDYEKLVFGNV